MTIYCHNTQTTKKFPILRIPKMCTLLCKNHNNRPPKTQVITSLLKYSFRSFNRWTTISFFSKPRFHTFWTVLSIQNSQFYVMVGSPIDFFHLFPLSRRPPLENGFLTRFNFFFRARLPLYRRHVFNREAFYRTPFVFFQGSRLLTRPFPGRVFFLISEKLQ